MRILFTAVVIGLAFTGQQAAASTKGEQRLQRLLVNRVAEAPVRCIPQTRTSDVQVIDRTALVYGSGRVIYVNRTVRPREINSSYVMVYRNRSGQLCRSDTIRLVSTPSRTAAGFMTLDSFVPWRRKG